jgi:hypothetical protein
MAGLNDDGQWIVMMALIICVVLVTLALIVNESTLVGKTTAESVLEFSKSDIQDVKNQVKRIQEVEGNASASHIEDIRNIALIRKHSLLDLTITSSRTVIHFNNGVNEYNEICLY